MCQYTLQGLDRIHAYQSKGWCSPIVINFKGKLDDKFRNQRQTALKLLNEGSDIDFVSRITGLTEKEILELQEKSR